MNDGLLTVSEVADRLRLGRTKVFQLIKDGELKTVKFGRATRVPSSQVDELIQRAIAREVASL